MAPLCLKERVACMFRMNKGNLFGQVLTPLCRSQFRNLQPSSFPLRKCPAGLSRDTCLPGLLDENVPHQLASFTLVSERREPRWPCLIFVIFLKFTYALN